MRCLCAFIFPFPSPEVLILTDFPAFARHCPQALGSTPVQGDVVDDWRLILLSERQCVRGLSCGGTWGRILRTWGSRMAMIRNRPSLVSARWRQALLYNAQSCYIRVSSCFFRDVESVNLVSSLASGRLSGYV